MASRIDTARRLRRDGTDAESFLWRHLRNRQLDGHKFRRQQPIGPYVVDFVCLERRLVVELDGGQHDDDEGRKTDARRTEFLNREGYRILRFWNPDVFKEADAVLERILESLGSPLT